MDEDRETTGQQRQSSNLNDAWRELADQLQDLGSKLAASVRTAWAEERPSEQSQRGIQDELRSSAERLERVVRRVVNETEAERSKTLNATREAGERSVHEARGAALQSLRVITDQLDLLSKRLERDEAEQTRAESTQTPPTSAGSASPPTSSSASATPEQQSTQPRRYSAL